MTRDQLNTVKVLTEFCQNFADQVLKIMQNSGLDRIDGMGINVVIRPDLQFTTECISFGCASQEAGYFCMSKGYEDEKFTLLGRNSAEYEKLFADPEVLERLQEAEPAEKPLPPDGLWISVYDDPPVLDSGRDLNDEVPEAD